MDVEGGTDQVRRWSNAPRLSKRTPPGSPPGTLVVDPMAVAPVINVIAFGPDGVEDHPAITVDALSSLLGRAAVTWVDVSGLADLDTVRRLGEIFNLHGLALEDVVNVHQRPKFEDYGDYLYVVTRMPAREGRLWTEQVSLFLWSGVVLTFQERSGDCFDPVRKRIRDGQGPMRRRSADYLAYALIDAATDAFFPVVENFGNRVEDLEDNVIADPDPRLMARIQALRHDLMGLRRIFWSQREMLNGLIRDSNELILDTTDVYLRDCYDHAVQLLDVVETYRDVASGLVDIHLSSLSNRMNQVMTVLTLIATIFIPLTFVTGIYGMNFDPSVSPWNMPELKWYWGYPAALGVMAVIAGGLTFYFWRKNWLGWRSTRRRRRPPM